MLVSLCFAESKRHILTKITIKLGWVRLTMPAGRAAGLSANPRYAPEHSAATAPAPFGRQVTVSEYSTAARSPPASEPANSHFLRPRVTPFSAFSAMLLSTPSSHCFSKVDWPHDSRQIPSLRQGLFKGLRTDAAEMAVKPVPTIEDFNVIKDIGPDQTRVL